MTGNGNFPKRGEIYWVDLDSAKGSETRKKRPALIVSNDAGNKHSHLLMIAPITSKLKKTYSFEVKTRVANQEAKIMLNQCRAIEKERLGEKLGEIDEQTLTQVEAALKIVFGLK